jgi:hypothetical protein
MYHIEILQYQQICMRDWGTVLLDIINIFFCFVLRRTANAKLQNWQCLHYSTGDEQHNVKSNYTDLDGTCLNNIPNDINDHVYDHLGDVLCNHTT